MVARHRGRVLRGSGLVLLLALGVVTHGGRLSTGTIQGTEAQEALAQAAGAEAGSSDVTLAVLFHSDVWAASDARFGAAVAQQLKAAASLDGVVGVVAAQGAPPALAERLLSSSGHDQLGLVRLRGDVRDATRVYPAVRAALGQGPLSTLVTGKVAFVDALNRLLEHDLVLAELLSFPLALVVLLRVFRTLVAALLPVAIGGLAVLVGVAGVLLLSHVTDMAQYTLNVVSLIGLGVAIDYSLFIVSRFRDELERGEAVEDALAITLDTAGRAVAFSGLAVGIGLSGLLFYRGSYLSAMGLGGALVVAAAVFFSLTFLPAVLSWLGPRVNLGRVPFPSWRKGEGAWHKLALAVMRHPVRVLLPTLAILVLVGVPFRRLELAATDITALPATTEARRAADALGRLFPKEDATRILVTVSFPSGSAFTPSRARVLFDASRRMAKLPGVWGVESIVDLDPDLDRAAYAQLAGAPESLRPPDLDLALKAYVHGPVAVFQVLTRAPAASEAARTLVRSLRGVRRVGDGKVLVGGQTASDVDASAFILRRTPLAVGFVMGMTCLVLFVLLGSVLLPLKAMAMNLLSIAGSFGALVWIFQEGHLSGVLHFTPSAIEPSLPVLLFCTIFGLSMDYEVLLLSRIREEWLRTGDNTAAVAAGLEHTGGLITSAAAIMVAVFAAFSLATIVVVKAMGVGMAIAVALDATLVRVLMVPAMMRLLGSWNWWAPAALTRMWGLAHGARSAAAKSD